MSGDGTNNSGRDVRAARDEAIAKDVTINGLVILERAAAVVEPGPHPSARRLGNYYRDNVIGGAGAFVMVAENFKSFGKALISKLIAEIASDGPVQQALVR